jgi:hypothetical protein
MEKIQKNTLIFCGLIGLIAVVYLWQLMTMWQGYAPSHDAGMFRSFFGFYYTSYAVTVVAVVALVMCQKDGRPLFLGALLCGLLFVAQQFTLKEIVDIRTYGFEVFIVSFYVWLVILFTQMVAAFIYPSHGLKITKYAAIFTFVMLISFAFTGRGSIEHLMPMVGGLYAEKSWLAAEAGKLLYIVPVFVLVALCFPVLYVVFFWATTGKFGGAKIVYSLGLNISFFVIIAMSFISLPLGNYLNNNDIEYTKGFVDELRDDVAAYYKEKGTYPSTILGILGSRESPRLLKRYEYLANNTKGGYFLSRESKYCFVFQDPGKAFGYYSVTSDRPWHFSHEGQDLTKDLLSVCDEGEMVQGEGLVAGHLGLDQLNDPIRGMMLELEDTALRPAVTQSATKLLEDRLQELGEIDSSIYGIDQGFDNGYSGKSGEMVRTTQELKRALINGPIEEPEFE